MAVHDFTADPRDFAGTATIVNGGEGIERLLGNTPLLTWLENNLIRYLSTNGVINIFPAATKLKRPILLH